VFLLSKPTVLGDLGQLDEDFEKSVSEFVIGKSKVS
jgi:hypothetical protein